MIQKVGLIGDVHCEDQRLETALRFFESLRVDTLLCTGNIVDGIGDPLRCIQLLRAKRVVTVRGNHDRWFLNRSLRTIEHATKELPPDAEEFLESLPTSEEFATEAGSLLLGHGVGDDDMADLKPETFANGLLCSKVLQKVLQREISFLLGGHTHQSMVKQFDQLIVINPGTLRRQDGPQIAYLELDRRHVTFYDLLEPAHVNLIETLIF